MLARLTEEPVRRAQPQSPDPPTLGSGIWGPESIGALEDLLKTLGPPVDIITSDGNNRYTCNMMTISSYDRRARMVNTPAPNGIYGDICKVYTTRMLDGSALLTVNAKDLTGNIMTATVPLGPRTLVKVDWNDGACIYNSDDIASGVMPRLAGLTRWREPVMTITSSGVSGPITTTSGSSSLGGLWTYKGGTVPSFNPTYGQAISSAVFAGLGAKTVKDGMVPPSVYKGPPAEPKPKKKRWKKR